MSNQITDTIKEKIDYFFERLRTQITRHDTSEGSKPHVFFVFGASVSSNPIYH